MARRSRDWNQGLAEDLKDPAFAREFLAAAVEDGVTLQQALGKVIRATGVKEFAARLDMLHIPTHLGTHSDNTWAACPVHLGTGSERSDECVVRLWGFGSWN
jgi:hypothetical protein